MNSRLYRITAMLVMLAVAPLSQASEPHLGPWTQNSVVDDNGSPGGGGFSGPFARGWFDYIGTGMVFSYYGWACLTIPATQSGIQQTISIVLSFGGPAGSGAPSQEFLAATSSRPDAASACFGQTQVGWSGLTFPISGPVYAYAKNQFTGELVLLGGSPLCGRWADGSPAC